MAIQTYNLGVITAYGDAVAGGYTGTKAEWQALMASYGTVGEQAHQDAQTATEKAGEASASATSAEEAKLAAETAQANAEAAAESINVDATLTIEDSPADAKATGDAIRDTYITKTAKGTMAHFEDGADNIPMKSVKVNISPLQTGSGDPSPTNVRPISGFDTVSITRTGKNLIPTYTPETSYNGVRFTVNDDGSVIASGTATATANKSSTFVAPVTGEYKLTGCPANGSGSSYQIWIRDEATSQSTGIEDRGSGSTGVLVKGKTYKVFLRINNGYTANDVHFYPMLRFTSDTDDTYEPYRGITYDISLSSAGTVYDGMLDVVSGVLTMDRKGVPMETLTWNRTTSYANPVFYSNVSDKAVSYEKTLCSIFHNLDTPNVISAQGFATRANDGDYACSNGNAQIYARLDSATTVQDFVTSVTGQTIVYPLATPLTYTLTPVEIKSLLGINNIWSDAGDVEVECRLDPNLRADRLQRIVDSSYVVESASAHFVDGADNVPMKSVKVAITPAQSGTGDPSPSNVRPISGFDTVKVTRCGRNFVKNEAPSRIANGVTFTRNEDGTFSLSGTSTVTATVMVYFAIEKTTYPSDQFAVMKKTIPNGTYRIMPTGSQYIDVQIFGYNSSSDYRILQNATTEAATVVVDDTYKYNNVRITLKPSNGVSFDGVTIKPCILLASDSDDAFEPYNGNTYDISLSSAETVYGGTLDVVSGELTVNRTIFVLNGTDRKITGTNTTQGTRYFVAGTRKESFNTSPDHPIYSDRFLGNIALTSPGRVYITGTAHNTLVFVLTDQTIATVDAANAWFTANPTQICYELATPITYQLAPTEIESFLGGNNIWSDAGDVEVEYRADTRLYINKLTKSDTDMIADANITSGKYFMVGNNLYKATANIANGAQIIVGTNCISKSLSEALNEINV